MMASRVVPAMFDTITRFRPRIPLTRDDFPTFWPANQAKAEMLSSSHLQRSREVMDYRIQQVPEANTIRTTLKRDMVRPGPRLRE